MRKVSILGKELAKKAVPKILSMRIPKGFSWRWDIVTTSSGTFLCVDNKEGEEIRIQLPDLPESYFWRVSSRSEPLAGKFLLKRSKLEYGDMK